MNNKIFSYLKMAGQIALNNNAGRAYLLGAVGVRKDGAIVSAFNGSDYLPNRMAHAEYRLCKKLDAGATVYVARVMRSSGEFGMSKPCPDCMRALTARHVKKIYYTIAENEYGKILC